MESEANAYLEALKSERAARAAAGLPVSRKATGRAGAARLKVQERRKHVKKDTEMSEGRPSAA